jgi:hypothetical protein
MNIGRESGENRKNVMPEPKKSKIPQVAVKEPEANLGGSVSPDDDAYSGKYINLLDDEPYALAITDEDEYGNTHHAKNSAHYWRGTATKFREQFEKA